MLDGVKDGLLENPTRCTFDPKEIECRSGSDGPNCLTAAQVEAVQKIYAGPTNPRTNEKVWSPLYRGSELDWSFFSEAAAPIGIATSALRMILNDPAWDYRTTPVDFDRHVALADRSEIARVNASNPDISAYVQRGGKLILSGGWNNALVPAGAVLDYYTSVEGRIGIEETQRGIRRRGAVDARHHLGLAGEDGAHRVEDRPHGGGAAGLHRPREPRRQPEVAHVVERLARRGDVSVDVARTGEHRNGKLVRNALPTVHRSPGSGAAECSNPSGHP